MKPDDTLDIMARVAGLNYSDDMTPLEARFFELFQKDPERFMDRIAKLQIERARKRNDGELRTLRARVAELETMLGKIGGEQKADVGMETCRELYGQLLMASMEQGEPIEHALLQSPA